MTRAGLAFLIGTAMAGGALAQDNPHSKLALELYDTCARIMSGEPIAVDFATADGWEVTPDPGNDPFSRTIAGSRTIEGLGQFFFSAILESYPSIRINFCNVQSYDTSANWPDLGIAALGGVDFEGTVETSENGDIFGAWERRTPAGYPFLLLARRTGSSFLLQITEVTPKVPNR